ncbi:MAG: hypothetical protein Q7U53_14445 [Anaerolineaceae bacterium]|nr:hypothetical protein [Anaerolineaceae bacterium]
MIKKITILILVLFFLSGCQSEETNSNITITNSDFAIQTPEPGKGNVGGKLLESTTKDPYEASLFLSKNLTADYPGYPPVISFSYQSNPRAAQDDEGNFLFKNIEPDKYVIVLYRPTGQEFIKDQETGLPIMYEVIENQILNLGIIEYP